VALLGRMFKEGEQGGAKPAASAGARPAAGPASAKPAGTPAPRASVGTARRTGTLQGGVGAGALDPEAASAAQYQELKSKIHNQLFEHLDLSRIGEVSEERVAGDILLLTRRILAEEKALLTQEERARMIEEIQDEVFGLGPLEPLLKEPSITDILVNGHDRIYVERRGKLERAVARFKDDDHLMRIIGKIISAVGRRIDELTPYIDARLADGSRVNAIIPPLAIDGPSMSIRRFSVDPYTATDLIEMGSLTEATIEVLRMVVQGRLNVLISGGTGVGKTTLLNVMSSYIPPGERIITIEDSAELQLRQDHVVRLETRPPNVEGKGRISQRDLVINSLRMRPDRIIVGEVRGGEALDMLQAMNTGHDGSMTTVHANTPRDAITRIETMVSMSGIELPLSVVRGQVASALDVVVQLARLSDGTRKVVSVAEITGTEGEMLSMSEIFKFQQRGVDGQGRVLGDLVATGVTPRFLEKLRSKGIEAPNGLFIPPDPAGSGAAALRGKR
jgi:pilus assembly protein CpaF